mgnify:CR=1 FL=1
MSIFDKFFTKFAYKFDKGYPDMNNDQDVLLLESLISEVIGERYSLEEANMVGPSTNYPSSIQRSNSSSECTNSTPFGSPKK